MSDSAPTDPQPLASITEEDIANYLVQTPDFFERHAAVLATVELSSPHGSRAVSLQERQAGLLREKIRTLEQKVVELIRHGQDNVAIADKLHAWTLVLLNTSNAGQLPAVMAQDMAARFAVPQVAIKVWGVAPEWANQAFAVGCSDNVQAFASSLTQPYCGANPGLEAASWLDDPSAAQSLALIALRENPGARAFGLLVLASGDTQRFTADMGTDFLEQIGDLASAVLARLRG